MCWEPVRHSTLDKGHEEGGLASANAGSSLRSPPGYSRSSPSQKKQSLPTLLLCALTSDFIGGCPPPTCARLPQGCLTICDPMDYSPPAPLSMKFSWKGYWSGLPCPSGDLPDPGIKPICFHLLHWQEGSLTLMSHGKPNIPHIGH